VALRSDQDAQVRWAAVLGRIGRTLIGIGVLLLLFVAYQLWGTSIHEARAQNRLEDQFETAVATTTTTSTTTRRPATTSSTTTTVPVVPPTPAEGEAVAHLRIPSIGVSRYVVEGVSVADLKQGPGHYPLTPLPGQRGNAAIAGHRTTYGAPFYDLDRVEEGDEIILRTVQGTFTYVVDGTQVVEPHQTEVLAPTDEARLTLTTCEPRYSARRRLIVTGVLREDPVPSPTTTVPRHDLADDVAAPAPLTLDDPGLSGDPAARWPTFWWALATALVGAAIWLVARWRRRRFLVYLAGAPVFLVVLFIFFENVSRLLPANI